MARGRTAAVVVAALACASGPTHEQKASLNGMIAARDWAAAARQLKETRSDRYADRDAVLYWLDVAAVLHDGGNFLESDQALDSAEQRMEELYTQSVTKTAGTFLLNDATDDYRGEPHERSLLHVLRALNYAYLGRTDEAVVEARKVSAFLAELTSTLSTRYVYRDDAFAQYLSALLFEDAGRTDDARISYQAAHQAYAAYARAYGTPEPVYDLGAMAPEEGEVVFLHYAGMAPRRASETIQIAWREALFAVRASGTDEERARVANAVTAGLSAHAVTVAFPREVQDPYGIAGSEIQIGQRRAKTLLVEDISAISRQALEDRNGAIRSRAIARAMIKYIIATVTEEETKKNAGQGWGFVAGVFARTAAAATEIADTRCWSTIPAQIRMARIRAPAGTQVVQVRYSSPAGVFTNGESLTVDVKPGRRTYVHVRTAM
jgi:uncharacterized protein